jgi:hypothetical protein
MARSRDRDAGADPRDLEVLDPLTGEAVPVDRPPAATAEDGDHPGRRRRRLAVGLALASVACAGAALWFGLVVSSLRAAEEVWADAMALDGAREAADQAVRDRLSTVGNPEDDAAGRAAIRSIGEETATRLLPLEERLREQRIADDRISDLRDLMLEALRFRRFQLSAERGLLGDTPLQKVEAQLDAQLGRFGLDRSQPPPATLASVTPALAALGRFADEETGTVLVASSFGLGAGRDRELLVVDIDASTVTRRTLPEHAPDLLAAGDLVIASDGGTTTAYPLDVTKPAVWRRDGPLGVGGRPGTEVAMWAWTEAGLVPVGFDGREGAPVPFRQRSDLEGEPWELLADTEAGLLFAGLADNQVAGRGVRRTALLLVDHRSGQVVRTIETDGRFAGASPGFLAIQLPGRPTLEIHRLADGTSIELPLPRTDAGRIVQAPGREAFAFAAGPLAGNIASVLRLEFEGRSWNLIGVGGPRATVRPNTLVWSPSGEHLFWITPDGHLAMARDEDRRAVQLRTPVSAAMQIVAFPAQR